MGKSVEEYTKEFQQSNNAKKSAIDNTYDEIKRRKESELAKVPEQFTDNRNAAYFNKMQAQQSSPEALARGGKGADSGAAYDLAGNIGNTYLKTMNTIGKAQTTAQQNIQDAISSAENERETAKMNVDSLSLDNAINNAIIDTRTDEQRAYDKEQNDLAYQRQIESEQRQLQAQKDWAQWQMDNTPKQPLVSPSTVAKTASSKTKQVLAKDENGNPIITGYSYDEEGNATPLYKYNTVQDVDAAINYINSVYGTEDSSERTQALIEAGVYGTTNSLQATSSNPITNNQYYGERQNLTQRIARAERAGDKESARAAIDEWVSAGYLTTEEANQLFEQHNL